MIDPNPNNSYKTKKNFTGFYTEVNPCRSRYECKFDITSFFNPLEIIFSKLCSVFASAHWDIIRNENLTFNKGIVLQSICGNFKNLNFVRIPQKIDMNGPNRSGFCLRGSLVDIRSMGPHHLNVLKLHCLSKNSTLRKSSRELCAASAPSLRPQITMFFFCSTYSPGPPSSCKLTLILHGSLWETAYYLYL